MHLALTMHLRRQYHSVERGPASMVSPPPSTYQECYQSHPIHVYCGIGTARRHLAGHTPSRLHTYIVTCTHARRRAPASQTPRHGHVVPHSSICRTAAVLPCLAQAVHHNARSLISQCHPRPSRRQLRHLAVSHPLCETAHAPQTALCKSG